MAIDWNGLVWLAFAALAGLAVDGWPEPAPVVGVVPCVPVPVGDDEPDEVPDGVPEPDGEPAPEDGLEPPAELTGLDVEDGLEGALGVRLLPEPAGALGPVATGVGSVAGEGGVGLPP